MLGASRFAVANCYACGMSATIPTRIDRELFESAKSVGAVENRSAAQQIDYWARVGRQLVASPGMSVGTVQRVLAGKVDYDSLYEPEQSVVRTLWDEQINQRLSELDFASEFTQRRRAWSEADDAGDVVMKNDGDL